MPTLKWTEVSLSFVQCFLYLVSSSISVSGFHINGWIPSGQTVYTLWAPGQTTEWKILGSRDSVLSV